MQSSLILTSQIRWTFSLLLTLHYYDVYYYSCGLSTTTIEYSCLSVFVSVCSYGRYRVVLSFKTFQPCGPKPTLWVHNVLN